MCGLPVSHDPRIGDPPPTSLPRRPTPELTQSSSPDPWTKCPDLPTTGCPVARDRSRRRRRQPGRGHEVRASSAGSGEARPVAVAAGAGVADFELDRSRSDRTVTFAKAAPACLSVFVRATWKSQCPWPPASRRVVELRNPQIDVQARARHPRASAAVSSDSRGAPQRSRKENGHDQGEEPPHVVSPVGGDRDDHQGDRDPTG